MIGFEHIVSGLVVAAVWFLQYKGLIGGGSAAPSPSGGVSPPVPAAAPTISANLKAALKGVLAQAVDELLTLPAAAAPPQAGGFTVHVSPTAAPSAPTVAGTPHETPKAA